jgi:hypothetical protein
MTRPIDEPGSADTALNRRKPRALSMESSSPSKENSDTYTGPNGVSFGDVAAKDHGRLGALRVHADHLRVLAMRNWCTRAFALVIVGLLALLAFSTTYGWIMTVEPCEMAGRTLKFIAKSDRHIDGKPPVFPKVVHQQWKTDKIPEGSTQEMWRGLWKQHFPEPEYTYMLWTDETQRELIKNHFPFFLDTYDNYRFNIQRADAVRYFILYMYGGIYADLDYEPLTNFYDYLPKDRVALVESPYQYNEYLQNSLMSSPLHDPFWNHTFAVLMKDASAPVLSSTGPVFLDNMIKTAKHPYWALPCENFQRLPMGETQNSHFISQLHREVLGRLAPIKSCGYYANTQCHFAKHHNTATYLKDTGVIQLIWV